MKNEQTITNDFTLDLGTLGVSDFKGIELEEISFDDMEFEEINFDSALTDI